MARKCRKGIGAGIVGPRTKLSIPKAELPSIFQAGVFAISRCIEINLHRNYRNERIAILSDCQTALKAISSYEINSLLVQECRERLNSLAERNQVHLIWVPSHRGIAGNELADELARSAVFTKMVGPEPFTGIGPLTIKELLRKEEGLDREDHWQQTQAAGRIVYWLSHLYNMGLSSCANCRSCDREPETPEYLLIDCTAVCGRRITAGGFMFPVRDRIALLAPGSLLDFINALELS